MNAESLTLIDANGIPLAELLVTDEKNGWLTGKVISEHFPPKLKGALTWYDEVVENQMLSFLDRATDAVEEFSLRIRYPNGAAQRVFSFHVNQQDEVSFRTSPTLAPGCQADCDS